MKKEEKGNDTYKKFLECVIPPESQDHFFEILFKSESKFNSKDDKENSVAFWNLVNQHVIEVICNFTNKTELIRNCIEEPYSCYSLLVADVIEKLVSQKGKQVYGEFLKPCIPFGMDDSFPEALYNKLHTEKETPKLASINFWELFMDLVSEAIYRIPERNKFIINCIKKPSSARSFWGFCTIKRYVEKNGIGACKKFLKCVASYEDSSFY